MGASKVTFFGQGVCSAWFHSTRCSIFGNLTKVDGRLDNSDQTKLLLIVDFRLYRCQGDPQSKEGAGVTDWQCVAITLEEWQSRIEQLQKSTNEQEKELYTYLNESLFNPVVKIVLEVRLGSVARIYTKP